MPSFAREDVPDPFLEWLKAASPEDWHQIAWNWNWGNGFNEYLQWIIRQPDCDRGTAVLIYWVGGAAHLISDHADRDDVNEMHREHYDGLREIEDRYMSGFYSRARIAFDPRNDEGEDWTIEEPDEPIRKIPEIMYQPTPGEVLEQRDGFDEGFPPELWKRYEWVELHKYWRLGIPIEVIRRDTLIPKVVRLTDGELAGRQERGFIRDIGPELFLLSVVAEDLRLNGFRVFRWRDLYRIHHFDSRAIYRAFEQRSQTVPELPAADLGSMERLLASVTATYPLATFWIDNHSETWKDRCRERVTGRVWAIEETNVVLRTPTDDGEWPYPITFPLDWIRRIDFGGATETMLAEILNVSVADGPLGHRSSSSLSA